MLVNLNYMHSNNLRPGNIYFDRPNQKIIALKASDINNLPDHYEPCTLSGKWFDSIGLELTGKYKTAPYHNFHEYKISDDLFIMEVERKVFSVYSSESEKCRIEFVHELQNFWFDEFGVELRKIK